MTCVCCLVGVHFQCVFVVSEQYFLGVSMTFKATSELGYERANTRVNVMREDRVLDLRSVNVDKGRAHFSVQSPIRTPDGSDIPSLLKLTADEGQRMWNNLDDHDRGVLRMYLKSGALRRMFFWCFICPIMNLGFFGGFFRFFFVFVVCPAIQCPSRFEPRRR